MGEAVGGEEIDVVDEGAVALDVGLDGGLGADGAGDEVAHGGFGRLGGSYLAGTELLFDEGVVVGELLKVTAAAAVTAAVAYVGEPQGWRIGGAGVGVVLGGAALAGGAFTVGAQDDGGVQERDECGAHAGELRRVSGLLIDSLICGVDGGTHASERLLR